MNIINRSVIERAAGIVDGIASTLPEKQSAALLRVCDLLDSVLDDEEEAAARSNREKIIDEMAGKLTGRFNVCPSAMYSESIVRDLIEHVAKEMKGEPR